MDRSFLIGSHSDAAIAALAAAGHNFRRLLAGLAELERALLLPGSRNFRTTTPALAPLPDPRCTVWGRANWVRHG